MSYVAEVLQPGETLRFRTNIHWFVYLNALIALIVGLALLGWYYAEGQSVFILLFGGVVFTGTDFISGGNPRPVRLFSR
jgi:1,4-dihydroxy-2-naphthoate octaprenyltransferase